MRRPRLRRRVSNVLRRSILLPGIIALWSMSAQISQAQSNSFTMTTLVNFSGANGAMPVSNLIEASDGNLYGTTLRGGTLGNGSVFQLTPAGVLTTIHNFAGADGRYPYGSLVEGADGYLYGTTTEGGALEQGTVFRIAPDGVLTTLHSFTGLDGNMPYANLVPATDGNFYGTTAGGGSNGTGYGSLFRMTPTGVVTTQYSFTGGNDGRFPYNSLLQASDGNLYGVTSNGGPDNCGSIFQAGLGGEFVAVDFTGGSASISAYTSLDEDGTQHLYGTLSSGGTTGHGELFSFGAGGVITTVYDFPAGGDGGIPYAGMMLGTDGNQYGSAYGYFTDGGLFSFSSNGELQTLVNLGANTGQLPVSSLMQASDGNFYGTASAGGSAGDGTVFRLAPSNALPAPLQLEFEPKTVAAGATAQLSWQVINAYSDTLQRCVATVAGNPAGAGNWSGLQYGELSGEYYSGSASIVPTEPGQYTYALTCGGVESGRATLVVTGVARKQTSTAVQTSAATLIQGESATLTATLTYALDKNHDLPTGTATFHNGTETIGQAQISAAGTAAMTASTAGIPAGNYIVSASYSGDANYAPSNSPGAAVNLQAQTAIELSVTPTTISSGMVATLLAAVSEKYGKQLPTGVVTFYYKSRVLGQSNLLNGQTTWVQSTQGLAPGSYTVTAVYAGDAGNAASSATPLVVTVTQ